MHFFYGLEGPANLGYRHRGSIYPIIQHILILNINKIVHKLVGWWREDESPITQGAPIEDLNKKSCTVEESLQN